MIIYTIGHSTRKLEEFIDVLKNCKIDILVDVRKFPTSKKFPWFNKEILERELEKVGIRYFHYPELGGFRKEGYEAFSKTEEFFNAVKNLLQIVDAKNTAIMCAEIVPFRCHRRYIAEALVLLGHKVIHIYEKNKIQEHKPRMKEMELKIFCDKVEN